MTRVSIESFLVVFKYRWKPVMIEYISISVWTGVGIFSLDSIHRSTFPQCTICWLDIPSCGNYLAFSQDWLLRYRKMQNLAHSWILNSKTAIIWASYHIFCSLCFKCNNICAINGATPSAGKMLITKWDVFSPDSVLFTLNPIVLISCKMRHEISWAKWRIFCLSLEVLIDRIIVTLSILSLLWWP